MVLHHHLARQKDEIINSLNKHYLSITLWGCLASIKHYKLEGEREAYIQNRRCVLFKYDTVVNNIYYYFISI